MKNYQVIIADNLNQLERDVSSAIEMGFKTCGGICVMVNPEAPAAKLPLYMQAVAYIKEG